MLPLKFPNSDIRTKVFIRKIGFKLHVMRLNRVESFYAFLLCFHSEGSEEEGRLATASPHIGSATHGQVAAKALARRRPVVAKASLQGQRPQPALSPIGA
ncbi:hypothetical protein B296_00027716, partial [Ensete ventricosum]